MSEVMNESPIKSIGQCSPEENLMAMALAVLIQQRGDSVTIGVEDVRKLNGYRLEAVLGDDEAHDVVFRLKKIEE